MIVAHHFGICVLHDLKVLLRSRYGFVHLQTLEEKRAVSLLRHLAADLEIPLFRWSRLRGLALDGETEEQIRAGAQAQIRRLIDAFIDTVKENVTDEETRERIRRTILDALPEEEADGVGQSRDEVLH